MDIISLIDKFGLLVDENEGKVDALVISETKLDESFPIGQFIIPGFSSPNRRNRNQ